MNFISELAGMVYDVLDVSQGLSEASRGTTIDAWMNDLVEAGTNLGIHRSGLDSIACGTTILVYRDVGKELDMVDLEEIERAIRGDNANPVVSRRPRSDVVVFDSASPQYVRVWVLPLLGWVLLLTSPAELASDPLASFLSERLDDFACGV